MSADKPKESAASRLTRIARERYTFGRSVEGEPYGLPLDGPRIVTMLRGGSGSLRAELAAAYLDQYGSPPPQQALTDCLTALEGLCLAEHARRLWLRVAEHDGAVWLDLGDDTGDVVRIDGSGWEVRSEAPVLHRRTALTAALPRPLAGGDLGALWSLANVTERDRPVLIAVLIAALLPDIPHPILSLSGEQGAGKSTASKVIASTLDPSTVPLRKSPRDLDAWTTAAFGSWFVAVDNLSALPDWLSDALCRSSTGDGDVRRRLYTDGDLHVVSFRRVVLLNGIDLGAVRDDLADRLVTVELHRIEDDKRAKETTLTQQWREAAPGILGGLLDLAVQVLAVLPEVELERSPRMADFAQVLAGVDRVLGTDGLARYRALAGDLARDAVSSDPVLSALTTTVTVPWRGAVAELLETLSGSLGDSRPPRDWPKSARVLATLLRRRSPSLRRVGWTVEQTEERSKRGAIWDLIPPRREGDERGDEIGDEPISSPSCHPFRHPAGPDLTCGDLESGRNGDEVTTNRSNLSPVTSRSSKERESREPSSSRHLVTEGRSDFTRPSGPGRCTGCGFHVATQGHAAGCSERNAS